MGCQELRPQHGPGERVVHDAVEHVTGQPAVYSSAETVDDESDSSVETFIAGGAVVLVIVAGGALVVRQRRMRESS